MNDYPTIPSFWGAPQLARPQPYRAIDQDSLCIEQLNYIAEAIGNDDFKNNFEENFSRLHQDLENLIINTPDIKKDSFHNHVSLLANILSDLLEIAKEKSYHTPKKPRISSDQSAEPKRRQESVQHLITGQFDFFSKSILEKIGLSEASVKKLECSPDISYRKKCQKLLNHTPQLIKILNRGIENGIASIQLMRIIGNYDNIDLALNFLDSNYQEIIELSQQVKGFDNLSQLLAKKNGDGQTIIEKYNYIKSNVKLIQNLTSYRKDNIFILRFISSCPLSLAESIALTQNIKESFIEAEKELSSTNRKKIESSGWESGWEILSQCEFSFALKPEEAHKFIIENKENIKKCLTSKHRDNFKLSPRNISQIISRFNPEECKKILGVFASIYDSDDPEIHTKLNRSNLIAKFSEFIEIIADDPENNLTRFLKILKFLDMSSIPNFSFFWRHIPEVMNHEIAIDKIDQKVVMDLFFNHKPAQPKAIAGVGFSAKPSDDPLILSVENQGKGDEASHRELQIIEEDIWKPTTQESKKGNKDGALPSNSPLNAPSSPTRNLQKTFQINS